MSSVKTRKKPSVLRDLGALILKMAVIAGIAALVFTFIYGIHYNTEPGMNPAVKDGDLIIYYRWDKDYHAGELLLLTFQGQTQVRRVVATAGDTVDICEQGLLINGALQQEPNISQPTWRYEEGIDFPLTLGEDEVFVLGDARDNATDSRIYGAVHVKDTLGTVITLFRRRNL
jgi:signal peptidase I